MRIGIIISIIAIFELIWIEIGVTTSHQHYVGMFVFGVLVVIVEEIAEGYKLARKKTKQNTETTTK
jgi:hypothetical protein